MEQSKVEDYIKAKLSFVPLEEFIRNLPLLDMSPQSQSQNDDPIRTAEDV